MSASPRRINVTEFSHYILLQTTQGDRSHFSDDRKKMSVLLEERQLFPFRQGDHDKTSQQVDLIIRCPISYLATLGLFLAELQYIYLYP